MCLMGIVVAETGIGWVPLQACKPVGHYVTVLALITMVQWPSPPPPTTQPDLDSAKQMKHSSNKCTCWKYDDCIADGWPFFFCFFFCCCSKDYLMYALQVCVALCVSVRSSQGWSWSVVLALCFWRVDASSVFISTYSYISIFLTVLSGSAVYVMSVYGNVLCGCACACVWACVHSRLYAEPH